MRWLTWMVLVAAASIAGGCAGGGNLDGAPNADMALYLAPAEGAAQAIVVRSDPHGPVLATLANAAAAERFADRLQAEGRQVDDVFAWNAATAQWSRVTADDVAEAGSAASAQTGGPADQTDDSTGSLSRWVPAGAVGLVVVVVAGALLRTLARGRGAAAANAADRTQGGLRAYIEREPEASSQATGGYISSAELQTILESVSASMRVVQRQPPALHPQDFAEHEKALTRARELVRADTVSARRDAYAILRDLQALYMSTEREVGQPY